jgi:hypothetical protein
VLLGKILRIDVDGGDPYAIPPDNPFVGNPDFLDEIWAYGLRNPWRFAFDRKTGDLYIGDVGYFLREEIDVQPADSPGGENYGWRCMEGRICTNFSGCECEAPDAIPPVHEYTHESNNCSVTAGYVYRGCAIPELEGAYVFGDFCSSRIWTFRWDGEPDPPATEVTEELEPDGDATIQLISSFGEDAAGELYVVDLADGEVYRIVRRHGEVGIELASAVELVQPGGSIPLEATVRNEGAEARSVAIWLDVIRPDLNPATRNPIAGPFYRSLPPGIVLDRSRSLAIPTSLPPGLYGLRGAVGAFPDEFESVSCVTLIVE